MKVLFLTQTPQIGAAARYRAYQFIDYLKSKDIVCTVSPGISQWAVRNLVRRGNVWDRIRAYSQPFICRTLDLLRIKRYDVVFLQRDILIHFPPLFEWLISQLNKNLIFDFDDALYAQTAKNKYSLFYCLRGKNKIPTILKMAKYVIAGNNQLKEYALRYNKRVEVIPTSIDTDRCHPKVSYLLSGSPVIGWMGRPGSLYYLQQIKGVFPKLSQRYDFSLKVVGARDIAIEEVKVISKDWKLEEEIDDLQSFDIGIMPLTEDKWSQGKSAAKLLQYMAMGIPVICSAVGTNSDIVKDGKNGFLARTEGEWIEKLSLLIENQALREKLGRSGRVDVEKYYSVKANAPKLLNVLKAVGNEV